MTTSHVGPRIPFWLIRNIGSRFPGDFDTIVTLANPGKPQSVLVVDLNGDDAMDVITANRNDEGPESLEATIRTLNDASCLPVLTIADPESVLMSREYAERVAIQVLEYLLELGNFRGVGRLYVP